MKWYDIISNVYDFVLEKFYLESRKRAVELLDLRKGQILLDVACGTGANFKHIQLSNGNIEIYGTDYSKGMLKKGQTLIEKNNWNNITLLQSDARELTPSFLKKRINKNLKFDRIICVLGLSLINDLEEVLNKTLNLLRENGKIVIVDIYAEKRNLNTWVIEKLARADLNRKIWQTLEKRQITSTMNI
jgi:ubiquinone/menaquinone biosynthesis C-methylase UbiE